MKCAICGKEIKGVGHNPSPFRGTRCCDECNKYVIIARGFLSGLQTNMIMILGTDNSVSFQLNRTKENVTLMITESGITWVIRQLEHHQDACIKYPIYMHLALKERE